MPTETRMDLALSVTLTRSELRLRSEELARRVREYDVQEEAMKSRAAQAREALKVIRERVSELGRIVEDGRETRDVPCIRYASTDERSWLTVRRDTGELVETEPMTQREVEAELQLRLTLANGPRLRKAPSADDATEPAPEEATDDAPAQDPQAEPEAVEA